MINFRPPEARARPSVGSNSSVTAEKALSFISKGWQEVRSSADADLQLIKNRANKFKNLADRELENFLNSASISPFAVPAITASVTTTPAEIEFVKKLRPKLSEIRRAYSSSEFKWPSQGKLRIDLSAIRNAIVAEVEEEEKEIWRKWSRHRLKEERHFGEFDWEPIKALKIRLKELEVELKGSSSSPAEIFEGIKNSEFVGKVKSSLVISDSDYYALFPFIIPYYGNIYYIWFSFSGL